MARPENVPNEDPCGLGMDLPRPSPSDRGYALLVDADGAESGVVPIILDRLAALGPVQVRRLYGNLHGQGTGRAWENLARMKGFERKHRPRTTATKNGADIALAVDAMDLLAEGHRFFCLIAGDTDFGPLVERLHRSHCSTIIVSANPALHAWTTHAFTFKQVLALTKTPAPVKVPSVLQAPQAKAVAPPLPAKPPAAPQQAQTPNIEELLKTALKHAHNKGLAKDGWVDSERVGLLLPHIDKAYSRRKYGLSNKATMRSIAARFPASFEIQARTVDGVRHNFLRSR